jgi:hypothetical protein
VGRCDILALQVGVISPSQPGNRSMRDVLFLARSAHILSVLTFQSQSSAFGAFKCTTMATHSFFALSFTDHSLFSNDRDTVSIPSDIYIHLTFFSRLVKSDPHRTSHVSISMSTETNILHVEVAPRPNIHLSTDQPHAADDSPSQQKYLTSHPSSATTKRETDSLAPPKQLTGTSSTASTITNVDGNYESLASMSNSLAAQHTYVVYPRRWYGLSVVFWLILMNSLVWINYASISSLSADYYRVSTTAINGFSIIFLACFGPGYILALWGIEKYGIKQTVIFASFVQAAGSWIRVMGCRDSQHANEAGYALGMIGQALAAIVAPTFNMIPCRYAVEWFPSRILASATTLMVISNPLGTAIGSFVPSIVVSDSGGMRELLIGIAILCTVPALMALPFPDAHQDLKSIAIRQAAGNPSARIELRKPPNQVYQAKVNLLIETLIREATPEAMAEREKRNKLSWFVRQRANYPLINDCCLLLTNWNFMMLFIGYTVGVGIANAFVTLIEQMIKPSGYTKDNAGNFGGLIIFVGLIGSFVSGTLMDRWRRAIEHGGIINPSDPLDCEHRVSLMYRNVLRFFLAASMISVIIVLLLLRPNIPYILGAAFAVVGFFVLPLLPIMILLSSDCSPDTPTDASTGMLQVGSNYGGIIMIGIFSALIEASSDDYTGVVTPVAIAVFFFLLACVTTVILGYNYRAALPPVDSLVIRPTAATGSTNPDKQSIELQTLAAGSSRDSSPDTITARSSSPLVAIHIDPSPGRSVQQKEHELEHSTQASPSQQQVEL